jgi:N-acylneuraminate cytidylyltransferase
VASAEICDQPSRWSSGDIDRSAAEWNRRRSAEGFGSVKLAIIPARGGSKRIPHKNIKLFCGVPIIARSISAALESGLFDRVVVSTDDVQISEVARASGAEVPFIRPAHLSDDYTGTMAVVAHVIEWYCSRGFDFETVCCIYATAPFVTALDLKIGFQKLMDAGADFALSVTRFAAPIQRAIRMTKEGRLEMFQPHLYNTRSQDLEEAFHDAGQFYWGRADSWCAQRPMFSATSVPVLLPRSRVQDIDTPEDWILAELMFRSLQLQYNENGN